jgi:hypothetical protein
VLGAIYGCADPVKFKDVYADNHGSHEVEDEETDCFRSNGRIKTQNVDGQTTSGTNNQCFELAIDCGRNRPC